MRHTGKLTRSEAIQQIATQLDGPIDLHEFTSRVLAIWPSRARNPHAGVRQAIRGEQQGKALLFLDKKTLIPMQVAMPGIRFRIPLTRQEIKKGWLFIYPAFQYVTPQGLLAEAFQLEDAGGHSIPTLVVRSKTTVDSPFGSYDYEQTAFDLGRWYKKQKVRRNDSLLVTVMDWETSHFRLQHEPAHQRKRHRAEIQQRNQELADQLFDLLESARYEYVWGRAAIPTAYVRLKNRDAYPADHWAEVLEKDSRMRWTGTEIRYADWSSPLENTFADVVQSQQQPAKASRKHLAKQQAKQVYRFKASLWHRKGLWRRIEIQGDQTLADFDGILRGAFQHDFTDHLSGFWKLVRRGKSRRFREIDLGNINPFGEGEAADVLVAGLDLEPGDALKYVYDFGDWIQHRIELEAIGEPEIGADYPRVVGQNKPRYRYCRHCKEEGRKTVATWICIECSNWEQEPVPICEACADTHHEEHYIDEMLY